MNTNSWVFVLKIKRNISQKKKKRFKIIHVQDKLGGMIILN